MEIVDRRTTMDLVELIEELTCAWPEEVAGFEARHRDAWEAVVEDDLDAVDADELDDLRDDLVARLSV